jgi:hypothetical protein
MHLIAPLASGIVGAGNGSAAIYVRGTAQFATYYQNFNATGAVTPVAAAALDANGGGTFYVNQLVDVLVKDSSGNTIRSFAAGSEAPNVEVISQSFTGTDYTTGQSAASKPTTLQRVLDKWFTSAGAIDFNVLIGGVSTSLQTMVANTTSAVFFNVKASTYGAVGDGVNDDTSAIQAAATAASAAGGGTVYFPPGTYKVTGGISFAAGVAVQGASSSASTIAMSGTFASCLTFNGSGAGIYSFLRDLTITQTSGQVTNTILLTASAYLRVDGCKIATTKAAGSAINDSGTSHIILVACVIDHSLGVAANNTRGIVLSSTTVCTLIGVTFLYPATFNGKSVDASGANMGANIAFCDFQTGSITTGTCTLLDMSGFLGNGPCCIAGNFFAAIGAGTPAITPWSFPVGTSGRGLMEIGNTLCQTGGTTFSLQTSALAAGAATITGEGQLYATRVSRNYVITTDTTPITLPSATYSTVQVVKSTNAVQTLNFDDPPGAGHFLTLAFNNNQGGASGTITIGGTNVKGLVTFTVNANKVSYYHFRSVGVAAPAGKWYWSLIGSDLNESP